MLLLVFDELILLYTSNVILLYDIWGNFVRCVFYYARHCLSKLWIDGCVNN